jgi:hypothetical protein
MITFEVHEEVQGQADRDCRHVLTCYECHRSFRAKSEDQLCLALCDACFEDLRHLHEPVISVHVKARPRRPSGP